MTQVTDNDDVLDSSGAWYGFRNPSFESFQKEPLKEHKTPTAFNNQKLSLVY
jgi:hypothetical protein